MAARMAQVTKPVATTTPATRAPAWASRPNTTASLSSPWPGVGNFTGPALRPCTGAAVPEADLPPPFEDRRVRPDPEFERRVGLLKAKRDAVALELGLEPGMVGGRSLLEAIQRRIDAGEDPAATPDLRAWQWNLIGPWA